MKYIIAECYKYNNGELIDWGRYFIFKDKLPKWEHCKFEILLETEDYILANETLRKVKLGGKIK